MPIALFRRAAQRRILIVDAHPDDDPSHFVHAIAARYGTAATEAGHEVRNIVLARIDIPFLTSPDVWAHGEPPARLREAQDDMMWANHLVFVYPLWLGDMPALLKAFLEQVFRPGFAFRHREGAMPEPGLKGRSARIIVTMGMPALVYRGWFGAHSLRSFGRNILHFVGIRPVRYSVIGGVDAANRSAATHLRSIARLGRLAL